MNDKPSQELINASIPYALIHLNCDTIWPVCVDITRPLVSNVETPYGLRYSCLTTRPSVLDAMMDLATKSKPS